MRILTPSKHGLNKIKALHKELKSSDIEESVKSIPPGEWCAVIVGEDAWIGFLNPLVQEKYSRFYIVDKIAKGVVGNFIPETFVKDKIQIAFEKRKRFLEYDEGARVFYGASDGLPGLIIDRYLNAAIIQINTAGLDKYRELIRNHVSHLVQTETYLLDNEKYREKEFLPVFKNPEIPELQVKENGLEYRLRKEIIQKVGFYYDHRENRKQLSSFLNKLVSRPKHGVDLFCYAGSWGLNALKAGILHMDFVDQGDFDSEIHFALEKNSFQGKGKFIRQDVFKFLDEAISKGRKYDLVLSDPPAFAKSQSQKEQAIEGYSKLHRKVFKITSPGAICVFSSCTHYVGHDEFQKNILDAAKKENKSVQLLHCGMQGWDHPITSLEDRANYIKSYTYILE